MVFDAALAVKVPQDLFIFIDWETTVNFHIKNLVDKLPVRRGLLQI
jgi:hypothetical protein